MTGILKAIVLAIPAFALSIFAALFVRIRLEAWKPPSDSTWNAILLSVLTLLTFAAAMWLCARLTSWFIRRSAKGEDQ